MFDKILDVVTEPVRHANDLVDGLLEGQIRKKAALKLGEEVVAGMAVSEIIELLEEVE